MRLLAAEPIPMALGHLVPTFPLKGKELLSHDVILNPSLRSRVNSVRDLLFNRA